MRSVATTAYTKHSPCWAFAAKDVTGRREAEAAHRKLQALLQSTTDAVIALDSAARFTYVNAEAERILQQPRHLLLGHCVWEVFPDIVGTEIEAAYYRMVENGAPTTLETYYAPTEAWIEVRAFPIQPDSDACAAETAEPLSAGGLCVHFRDITSRKAIEAERDRLLEQERAARAAAQVAAQEVRVVLDVLPVGVAIVDAQGTWAWTRSAVRARCISSASTATRCYVSAGPMAAR